MTNERTRWRPKATSLPTISRTFLDIIDVDGDLEMDVENDRAMVAIVGRTSTSWSVMRARCWTPYRIWPPGSDAGDRPSVADDARRRELPGGPA